MGRQGWIQGAGAMAPQTAMLPIASNSVKNVSHKKTIIPPKIQFCIMALPKSVSVGRHKCRRTRNLGGLKQFCPNE